MDNADTQTLFDQYVVPNYGRFPLRLARGKGCRVWDEDGKEYLDFGAGIAVTSVGHAHPRVTAAMTRQMETLTHVSNLYYTRPQGELAERLVRHVGEPGKVFFCNSGGEANEALFKLARKFGNEGVTPVLSHDVGEIVEAASHRYEIITFEKSFHGRTLAGIITSDTPESITLLQALGVEENIPRANIKSLTASEHSLMPAGLETVMKPQDLADLLSFLKGEAQTK